MKESDCFGDHIQFINQGSSVQKTNVHYALGIHYNLNKHGWTCFLLSFTLLTIQNHGVRFMS